MLTVRRFSTAIAFHADVLRGSSCVLRTSALEASTTSAVNKIERFQFKTLIVNSITLTCHYLDFYLVYQNFLSTVAFLHLLEGLSHFPVRYNYVKKVLKSPKNKKPSPKLT